MDPDKQYFRAGAWLRDELGAQVYGLTSIFVAAAEHRLKCPVSEQSLFTLLREHLYVEGEKEEQLLCKPGLIQVYTDDDNLDVAYYFFDGQYLKEHGHLATFILHEPWRFPTTSGPGDFFPEVKVRNIDTGISAKGGTYFVVTEESSKRDLAELHNKSPLFFPGVPLSQLVPWLRNATPADDWPDILVLLWALLPEPGELSDDDLRDSLDRVCWFPGNILAAIPDARKLSRSNARQFLDDSRGQCFREKWICGVDQSRVQTSAHLAQLCWCITAGPSWAPGRNIFNQWYLFDDCWAGANSDLTHALMRFATQWDVLTPEKRLEGRP